MRPGDEVADRYRLEELHGRGPMSEVWRAHDATLDRTVALKLLGPTADLERFRREARAVASLGHENVMRVYDYGEDAAGPFMALEWLPGGTLEERLTDGALPAAEAGWIAHGMAAGLAHLHSRGFVHRDLKPANVLFDSEERPKLADFGLARSSGAGTLTEAGTVLGTAAYISPEQAAGEPATPASDVYSFGVVLFRMLTGALPFVADDALTLVSMHRTKPAPAVEELNPQAPPELAALANAALSKDPADRPPDGAALLAALGAGPATVALTGDTEQTRVLTTGAPPPGARSRRGAVAIALALLLLAALGGIVAWAVTRPSATGPAGVVSTERHKHRHTASTTTARSTTSQQTTTTSPTTATTHATTARKPPQTIPTTTPTPPPTTTISPPTTIATTATIPPPTTTGP